jgi:hypothetical protein
MSTLSPSERQAAATLSKELQAVIKDHDPAIAAAALTSALATLICARSNKPLAAAKFQAESLISAVERPPERGSVN